MNDKPKISVIIPVYNLSKYIEKCAKSVLSQSYENIELIIINDGSTDNSKEILDSLVNSDQRIVAIHQNNRGVSAARLTGVQHATGEWIGFVDGDDIIEPDMYERLLNNVFKYNADISHCGYQMVFPNRIDYYYNTGRIIVQDNNTGLKDLIEGKFIEPGLCNKLFSRDLFNKLIQSNQMDLTIKENEDLLMNFYLFGESKKSVYEDFCPYHYIVRKDSATMSNPTELKLRNQYFVLKTIEGKANNNPVLKKAITTRIVGNLISISIMEGGAENDDYKRFQKKTRRELRELIPLLLEDNYSSRVITQSILVSYFPTAYRAIHKAYAMLRGSYKKYRIN